MAGLQRGTRAGLGRGAAAQESGGINGLTGLKACRIVGRIDGFVLCLLSFSPLVFQSLSPFGSRRETGGPTIRQMGAMMNKLRLLFLAVALSWSVCFLMAGEKPLLTLDEFFDYVEIADVKISPNGQAVVVETRRADWKRNRFRSD